jgi:glycerol uptake facilitator-like aquaporin
MSSAATSAPLSARPLVAEAIGTALLLAVVVGSGVMAERLAAGNVALALLANSLATGAGLVALILTFAPVCGAHFNPLVTLAAAARGDLPWRRAPGYVGGQLLGAVLGVVLAHQMFGLPALTLSTKVRDRPGQLLSEAVATFGLILVVQIAGRRGPGTAAAAVGGYITAAYWFTASTSFANPAVTAARALTDSFAGIRPADAPGFVLAQCLGAAAAVALGRWLDRKEVERA